MALMKAAHLFATAAMEIASLLWTEIALFATAGIIYFFCVGGVPLFRKASPCKKVPAAGTFDAGQGAAAGAHEAAPTAAARVASGAAAGAGVTRDLIRRRAARGEWRGVIELWRASEGPDDLRPRAAAAFLADALRRAATVSPGEVAASLRAAAAATAPGEARTGILAGVLALAVALSKDDPTAGMADAALEVLEEFGQPADQAVYANVMLASLKRRDAKAAMTTGARAGETPAPCVRALLGAAAAQRGDLAGSLAELRRASAEANGAESLLPPAAVGDVFALAASGARGSIGEAAEVLRSLGCRLDAKRFDQILSVEARRLGPDAVALVRELVDVGVALGVPLRPASCQALAVAYGRAGDGPGLLALCSELEERSRAPDGIEVTEPLCLAIFDACHSTGDLGVAARALEMHRVACAGAPSGSILAAYCGLLADTDHGAEALAFYNEHMAPRSVKIDAALAGKLSEAASIAGCGELAERLAALAARPGAAPAAHRAAPAPTAAAPAACPAAPAPRVGDPPMANAVGGALTGAAAGAVPSREVERMVAAIRARAKERDLAGAEAVFRRGAEAAKSAGDERKVGAALYGAFLEALIRCADDDRVAEHWATAKELQMLDATGCDAMLRWHLGHGRGDEALAVARAAAVNGLKASAGALNELLRAKALQKDRRGVWNVVEEMQRVGLSPNAAACATLVRSLTPHSAPSEVRRVVGLLEALEPQVIDETLVAAVIETCSRINRLDVLTDLLRRRRGGGAATAPPPLAPPTYGSMIKAYGHAGDVERVRELWREMQERGVRPTSITLGCLVEALVSNGTVDEAWRLVQEQLEDVERRNSVNTVTFSTVLKGFAMAKQIDKAFAVYGDMKQRGVACSAVTYNTLLDACARSGSMGRALELLKDMAAADIQADIITYSTIVKGFCTAGNVDQAVSVLDEMKKDGRLPPDEIVYNSILDGYAKQHRVDDAFKLLEDMKDAGVAPTNHTISIVVRLLGQARRLDEAFDAVEDLGRKNGVRPNVQVYTCLLQGCVLSRQLDRAFALFEEAVRELGGEVDDKFYGTLARGCLQMHQPLRAVEVLRSAYCLPGAAGEAAPPARRGVATAGVFAGVEARALEEVAVALAGGSHDEQTAFAALAADLRRLRGVALAMPGDEAPAAACATEEWRRVAGGGRAGVAAGTRRRRPGGRQ